MAAGNRDIELPTFVNPYQALVRKIALALPGDGLLRLYELRIAFTERRAAPLSLYAWKLGRCNTSIGMLCHD